MKSQIPFVKKTKKQCETIITLNSLEELTNLSELVGKQLVIYKDYAYTDNGKEVYDDIYTIEIYDDYRE